LLDNAGHLANLKNPASHEFDDWLGGNIPGWQLAGADYQRTTGGCGNPLRQLKIFTDYYESATLIPVNFA